MAEKFSSVTNPDAYRQAGRCYILWMGKIGRAVNYINPAIDYGAKEPRAEFIVPLNRFSSVFAGSPVLPGSAFRTFVFRIVKFPAIHTCPSIFSGSALLFHHNILPCHEYSMASYEGD